MDAEVNWFFEKKTKWQEAFLALREIVFSFPLNEELKWGCPCYTLNDNNVLLIHGFKDYCAVLFMKGALMKDPKGVLIQQTKNVQSARQIRFKSLDEIVKQKAVIKSFIKQAIEIERSGAQVALKKTTEYEVPVEFQTALNEMRDLKSAFYGLTPGRQRGYLLYFSSAKQSSTRLTRIEKYVPKILNGKGLDD